MDLLKILSRWRREALNERSSGVIHGFDLGRVVVFVMRGACLSSSKERRVAKNDESSSGRVEGGLVIRSVALRSWMNLD